MNDYRIEDIEFDARAGSWPLECQELLRYSTTFHCILLSLICPIPHSSMLSCTVLCFAVVFFVTTALWKLNLDHWITIFTIDCLLIHLITVPSHPLLFPSFMILNRSLASECLLPYSRRVSDMATIMIRLRALETTFCPRSEDILYEVQSPGGQDSEHYQNKVRSVQHSTATVLYLYSNLNLNLNLYRQVISF